MNSSPLTVVESLLYRRWNFKPFMKNLFKYDDAVSVSSMQCLQLCGHSRPDASALLLHPLGVQVNAGMRMADWSSASTCLLTGSQWNQIRLLLQLAPPQPKPNKIIPTLVVHESLKEAVSEVLRHFYDVNDHHRNPQKLHKDMALKILPVSAGSIVPLTDRYQIIVHQTSSSTNNSVGYTIVEKCKKFDPSFAHLPPHEIKELVQKYRHKVIKEFNVPLITFNAETTIDVFNQNPGILSSAVVATDCTYYLPNSDHRDKAKAEKHTHWEELKPIVLAHPNTTFILTNIALDKPDHEIATFFLNENIPNILPWLSVSAGPTTKLANNDAHLPHAPSEQPDRWMLSRAKPGR